ncbi:MAG: EAL domain-containing protein [Ruminococcus sp.]|nr:EAL domain-containing protein [Ruminococcus sp.]
MEQETRTNVNGLRAVELYFRIIREIASGKASFLQTQTRLNTPGLGVMMPEAFRDVAEITNQYVNLFELELTQALESCVVCTERDVPFDWMSVYMPSDYLRHPRAEHKIMEMCDHFKVNSNKICFALSSKLLVQSDERAPEVLRHIRNRGFHFMLTGFGSNSCPLMKLSEYEVDYVMMSPEVTHFLGKNERSDGVVRSLIEFINELGASPVADGVVSSRQAEKLYEFNCPYCAGSLTGNYVQRRYLKKRSDDDKTLRKV